jgi:hypothetical protein
MRNSDAPVGSCVTDADLQLAEHLRFSLSQCEYRAWRASWKPDEWAMIFHQLSTLKPAMELSGIDTAAIKQLCEFAYARPKGDPALVDLPDELWASASRAVVAIIAVAQLAMGPTGATPTAPSVLMDCESAIGKYVALRAELSRQLLLLPNGWRIKYKRDPAKGDPSLPVKVTHHTAIMSELGGQAFDGIATFAQPETFAPFHDFELFDPEGNPSKDGTEGATIQMRLAFLLAEMLETMKVLVGSLAKIEHEAISKRWATDTMPLSRLAEALPVFPYWPRTTDRSKNYFDGIIAEEKALVDDARLALRRLILEARQGSHFTTTKPAPSKLQLSDMSSTRAKLTKDEANIKARNFLREHPDATSRELAAGVGCSTGLVSKLPAWQAVKEQRDKGRLPKRATTVALTRKMEQTVGIEDESLAKLIGGQEADDERLGAPRRDKVYRKP